jgi:hypothetical protein
MTNYREVSLETRVEILEKRIEDLERALEVKNSKKPKKQNNGKIFQVLLNGKPEIVFPWSHGLYQCPFCEKYPAGSTGPFWAKAKLPNPGNKTTSSPELLAEAIDNGYSCLFQRTCHYCDNRWVVGKEL